MGDTFEVPLVPDRKDLPVRAVLSIVSKAAIAGSTRQW
jgi:hypothetical protein